MQHNMDTDWQNLVDASNKMTMGIQMTLDHMKRQQHESVIDLVKKIEADILEAIKQNTTKEDLKLIVKTDFSLLLSEIARSS